MNASGKTLTIRSTEEVGEGFEEVTVSLEEFGRENDGNGNQAIIEGLNGQLVTKKGNRRDHGKSPPPINITSHNIYYVNQGHYQATNRQILKPSQIHHF
jgi:hypothetical protein